MIWNYSSTLALTLQLIDNINIYYLQIYTTSKLNNRYFRKLKYLSWWKLLLYPLHVATNSHAA